MQYSEQLEIYLILLTSKGYREMSSNQLYEYVINFWENGKRFNKKFTIQDKSKLLVMANFEDEV